MSVVKKKSISELLDELSLAYDANLVQGYIYNELTNMCTIEFYPRINLPIQTLVRHIETVYPVEYVHVKNNYTKLSIEIKISKWTSLPHKSIVRLVK